MPTSSEPRPVAATSAHLVEGAEVIRLEADACAGATATAAARIASTFRTRGRVLLYGNGGSAADCQHMAAEFVSRLVRDCDRRARPAIALTTDTSFLTVLANDVGFDAVLERQIEALGRRGDVLVAISTSGNSSNVLRAVDRARAAALVTIGLSGRNGRLATVVDVAITVPSDDTQHVQETHLAIEHAICEVVERELFPDLFKKEA